MLIELVITTAIILGAIILIDAINTVLTRYDRSKRKRRELS